MKIALNLKKGPKMSEIVKNTQELVKYRVSFDVLLDANDPGEPDWVLDCVWPSLSTGEDIQNFKVELVA